MNKPKILFAEEGAVYNLMGEVEGGYILKMKPFDSTQAIDIPNDWVYFDKFPREINEKIYYYCFVNALKERNYESAYYYATHISTYLAKKIHKIWFSDPAHDFGLDSDIDMRHVFYEIRTQLTFASLIFDVYSDKETPATIYPMKLEVSSRYKRRTRPYALSRIPAPSSFVDKNMGFNIIEMDNEVEHVRTSPQAHTALMNMIAQIETMVESDDDDEFANDFHGIMVEPPLFENVEYLEFRKGPAVADYSLIEGHSIGAGVVEVDQLIHPCVFLELFDCNDEPWVTNDNYNAIQRSLVWKKFQRFLQFSIDPKLGLFFRVAPTNTFVTLNQAD
jgi:hypothetical protein